MNSLTLNIYGKVKGKKKVVKTYKTETLDMSFGIVEDMMEILEKVQSDSDENAILEVIMKNLKNVKPLLLDVFGGLTEEELKTASTKEVVQVIVNIIAFAIKEIGGLAGSAAKNQLGIGET
ncbi:MAG: hypothetical protein IKP66_04095 [Lachnospiraceae bacterium]|nr:hypothetical protein [Lachnospiraceae bacterium]